MEGKTITGRFDINEDYTILKFDDGTAALVKMINAELSSDEVGELAEVLGAAAKAAPSKKQDKPPVKGKKEKAPAKGKKKELTYAEIKEMDHEELTALVKEKELDVDPEDFDEDEADEMVDFVNEVAEELDIDVPEEAKDDDFTWEDLEKMDWDELVQLISDEDLDTDEDDDDFEDENEEALRKAIAEELEIAVPAKKKKKGKK